MYSSCARLNFPDSCSTTTSSNIYPVETPAWFDSTNPSNNFEVFAVGDSTHVSPNLRNEDGESTAFVDIEATRATFAIEDIMHVSPNVMKEDEESELRANTQHFVVVDTKTPSSMIQEDQRCHFTDEMFDLDDIPKLFNDDFLVWTNAGSHQILHTVAKSKRQVAGGMNHIGKHFLELINGVYER